MIRESKPDSVGAISARSSADKKPGSGRKKRETQPKISLGLGKAELIRMIEQIKEEVDSHQRTATEIEEKIEKLATAAFNEMLKVKELKEIIESLKKEGAFSSEESGASAEEGQKPDWKQDLDRSLERLLAIKKLLENSLAPRKEKKESGLQPASFSSGKKKILIVDDDPITLKIIVHFLERENFAVSTSHSGADGLKKAFQEQPDLILLDIMMPDLNGFQFLSILQKDELAARIPVVILSSLAEEADVLRGLETGAVDYLTKPFSPSVLLAKIRKNLSSDP